VTNHPGNRNRYLRPDAATVYLVWELRRYDGAASGTVTSLGAVCTEANLADAYRRILQEDAACIRVWVEGRAVNHLFGYDDTVLARP